MSLDYGIFSALRQHLSQRDVSLFSQKKPEQAYPFAVMAVDEIRTFFSRHALLEKTFVTFRILVHGKEPDRGTWQTLIGTLIKELDGLKLSLSDHPIGVVRLIKTQVESVDVLKSAQEKNTLRIKRVKLAKNIWDMLPDTMDSEVRKNFFKALGLKNLNYAQARLEELNKKDIWVKMQKTLEEGQWIETPPTASTVPPKPQPTPMKADSLEDIVKVLREEEKKQQAHWASFGGVSENGWRFNVASSLLGSPRNAIRILSEVISKHIYNDEDATYALEILGKINEGDGLQKALSEFFPGGDVLKSAQEKNELRKKRVKLVEDIQSMRPDIMSGIDKDVFFESIENEDFTRLKAVLDKSATGGANWPKIEEKLKEGQWIQTSPTAPAETVKPPLPVANPITSADLDNSASLLITKHPEDFKAIAQGNLDWITYDEASKSSGMFSSTDIKKGLPAEGKSRVEALISAGIHNIIQLYKMAIENDPDKVLVIPAIWNDGRGIYYIRHPEIYSLAAAQGKGSFFKSSYLNNWQQSQPKTVYVSFRIDNHTVQTVALLPDDGRYISSTLQKGGEKYPPQVDRYIQVIKQDLNAKK